MHSSKRLKYYLSAAVLILTTWIIQAQFSGSRVNRWTPTADLAAPRAAACSARLADGRVLVAGGRGEAGALNSVELYGADGAFTAASPMREARAGAACVTLQNGNVLVTGGNNGTTDLASAELFDAAKGEWTSVGNMSVARSGHTATLSPWGAVILAGGEESGTVEAFLTNNTFRTLGKLTTPRTEYALAALSNHKILIAGGSHEGSPADTVEVFDADDNSIHVAGKMLTARRAFAAAALYDGTVLLTGGFDAKGKALATTEIFDPVKGVSVPGPALSGPRARHEAFLLPNNGKVLIVGGTDGTQTLVGTEVYTPWDLKLERTAELRNGRTALAGQILRRGAMVIAGGRGDTGPVAGSEVYGFATIESEKPDYSPGDVATLTGQGWKPGETVQLAVNSFPLDQHKTEFTATAQADGNGQVRFAGFNIDRSHSGVRFLARATGSESSAQTSFTDATYITTSTVSVNNATQPYGRQLTINAQVTASLAPPDGAFFFALDGTALPGGAVAINPATGSASLSYLATPVGNHTVTATYNGTSVGSPITDTWSSSSANAGYNVTAATSVSLVVTPPGTGMVGNSLTLTATVSAAGDTPAPAPTVGTVIFTDQPSGTLIGIANLNSSNIATFTTQQLHAGLHSIRADYSNAATGYSVSSSTTSSITIAPKSPPAWSINASPSSPSVGDDVAITFAINPAAPGFIATGTPALYIDGSPTLITAPLTAGVATFHYTQFTAGSHTIGVSYGGDADYDSLSPLQTTTSITVNKRSTTSTVTSSPATPVTYGQTVTLNGRVSGGTSTLHVAGATAATFKDNGSIIPGASALPVTDGNVSITPSPLLSAGTHPITLEYAGDASFSASTSVIYSLVVNKAVPTSLLTFAPQNNLNMGSTTVLTVTLTSPNSGAGAPPGTVTFWDNGGTIQVPGCINVPVSGPGPVTATCSITFDGTSAPKGGGTHSYTAVFNPSNPNWDTATSNAIAPVVGRTATTTSAPICVTGCTGATSTYGTSVTFTTAVTPAPANPAYTGNVQFYDNGSPIGTSVVPNSTTGLVTSASLVLSAGNHTITAKFLGDVNYDISTSSSFALTVSKATPSITYTSPGPYSATYGGTITPGQVSVPAAGNGVTPTGTLTLSSGATTLATGTLDGSGHFTFSNVPLPGSVAVGPNQNLTVTYSGDSNYANTPLSGALLNVTASAVNVVITSPTLVSLLPNSPTYGQNLTFVATFTGPGNAATGNIDLYDGANPVCLSVPVTNGVATCTKAATGPNNLGVGNHTLTATNFINDSNHTLGTVTPLGPFAVAAAATTTVLTSDHNPSQPGQQVTLTATVTVTGGGTAPTGTVTINNGSNPLAGCSSLTPNGSGVATCTYTFSTAGPYNLTAIYAGTARTATSQGTLVQTVSKPAPVISSITSGPANPTAYGQPVTFTAVVSVAFAGSTPPLPTGTLQLYDGGNTLGGALNIVASDNTAHTVTYSLTVPSGGLSVLSGGNHSITAVYSPGADPNYSQGNSATQASPVVLTHVVNPADSTTSNLTVTATPAAIVFGEAVTFSADVAPAGGGNTGVPTGNVQFYDNGNPIGNPQVLIATGGVQRATLANYAGLSRAAHNITATYLGDHNFRTSTTTTATQVTVDYDPTRTVLGGFPANPQYGAPITLTAQVCGLAPGSANTCGTALPASPGGTVSFYDGSTLLGTTSPVDGTGTASLTLVMQNPPFTNPVIGSHSITAVYNGNGASGSADPNFRTSTSAAGTLSIGKGTTTSSVVSSANPSVTGQPITFTATINAPASQATPPTGTVTFQDGGTLIGSSTIVTNGGVSQATLTVPGGAIAPLTVGQHVISVSYSGDASYNSSNSPLSGAGALVQSVDKAATTTLISSSSNQSNVGQQITLTATVSVNSPGNGVPTGTVSFINTSAAPQPVVLGTAPLVVTPVAGGGGNVYLASISLSTLPAGNPQIIARYTGDNSYQGSDSASLYQAVNRTPTNITLTTNLSPSIYGNQVTFGIGVFPVPPGTGTPTGQIEIFDGGNSLGIYTLQGGVYNYTTASLSVGTHTIGVNYKGDGNFQAVNSPSIVQTVSKVPTSLNLTSNATTAIASQIITFTAVLNPNPVPGVPFASGQVGFYDGTTLMGVANLQSNVATLNVANLSVGGHSISARYMGDGNWSEAVSGFYAQTVTPALTSVQLVSSANPSVWGQAVTFTVTVTVPFPGTVPATGQVVLQEKGNNITEPITADNGRFSITLSDLTPGTHNITATFLANASFSASSSVPVQQVVNKAPTLTTLVALPDNSTSNQQVTMTAVVAVPTPGAGTPTGTVEFVDTTANKVLGTADLKMIGGITTAVLVTDDLNQSGSPQLLTATYKGDGNFAASTSEPVGQSVFGTQITAVNGASYASSNFAADSWVTIYGDNLANTQLVAQAVPYPTALGGTTVQVTDANGTQRLAPLYFMSPRQINMVMPTGTAFGLATITVTNPSGASASTIVLVTRTAPGLFTANANGQGVAAAYIQRVTSDGSQTIENIASYDSNANQFVATPVTRGSDALYLELFGTGIRYTPSQNKVTCTIGGKDATILYAGAAPGFVGLDQVSVKIPDGVSGKLDVVVTVDGQASNTVTVTLN